MDKELGLEMTSEVRLLEIDILKILDQMGLKLEDWLKFNAQASED